MTIFANGKRPLEKGESSSSMSPPRYKRRKVSAIRDFPDGCGPNAVVSIPRMSKEGLSREKEGSIVIEVESSAKLNSDHCEAIKKTSSEEKDDLQSHAVDNEMVEVRIDLKEPAHGISKKVVDDETKLQPCLLPYYPMPLDFVWREPKYPPRRRVSAVRDFPVGCGRNVQKLGYIEEEHVGEREQDSKRDEVVGLKNANAIGGGIGADIIQDKVESLASEGVDTLKHSSKSDKASLSKSYELTGQEESSEENSGAKNEYEKEQLEYNRNDERDASIMLDELNTDLIVYVKDKNKRKKSVGVPCRNVRLQEESKVAVQSGNTMVIVHGLMSDLHCPWSLGEKSTVAVQREDMNQRGDKFQNGDKLQSGNKVHSRKQMVIVQGLMSAINCPWSQDNEVVKRTPSTVSVRKIKAKKKNDFSYPDTCNRSPDKSKDDKTLAEKSIVTIPYLEDIDEVSRPLDIRDNDDSSENDDLDNFQLVPRERSFAITLPPFGAGSASERGVRSKVREALRLFQAVYRKLLQVEEKSKDQDNESKRPDLQAAKVLKDRGMYVNTNKVIGSVPGVEVGDIFNYRTELAIVGLHAPLQGGIDTMKIGKEPVAISIVASGGYANDVDSSDVLIYTGQGGNALGKDKQPEDQKLEKGNLALKNCIDKKTLVRVIRGFKETKPSDTPGGRPKTISTYTYDGLYSVDRYFHDLGPHGKLVYKFELNRIPGQPELAWKEMKQSKKHTAREGRCIVDISGGKEKLPISVVNTIDDETPPPFTYITSMMFPDWCQPIPQKGCDCKNGCSDSENCACALKNGKEIPFNHNGAIVQAKPLVYECGPLCRCPPSCHNRVSQHGIKLPLEVFKTNSMGWGVRCLSAIPSGSFICEYVGELLDDKEAEQRTGCDEYLFDIGQNYNDTALWEGLSDLLPDLTSSSDSVIDVGFTIDAVRSGNVGRFINHSCTPNLYAQNVLYDHEDKRIPHIMFFAAENIPPLQELTYHYNYTLDQVLDSEGKVKKKNCYCGSAECTGRMY